MNSMVINRMCSCGKFHSVLPEVHSVVFVGDICDGIWFDCVCRSTIFIPARLISGWEKVRHEGHKQSRSIRRVGKAHS